MQKALITGATSGIGLELAKVMAVAGHDLVLVSRSEKHLKATKKDIEQLNGDISVETVASDLSEAGSAQKLYEACKDKGVEILVNNAGVGYVGDFFEQDIARNQALAQLNMVSLMDLSYYFGADFVKNNSGKILNTASIVSFFPGPKQPIYYASKAFVRSLTRALAYHLRDTDVTVTALHPGVTKTHFFTEASAKGFSGGASPAKVAQLGYNAMMSGKIETTYGLWNRFLTNVFVRIMPYRLQTVIVDKASDV